MRSVTVLQPLNAMKMAPSAYNGENRFIIAQAECIFFCKESLELVLMSPAAFLCGICPRYRLNRVGRNQRRCLLWISTQAKSLPYQPPPQIINARVQETSIPI